MNKRVPCYLLLQPSPSFLPFCQLPLLPYEFLLANKLQDLHKQVLGNIVPVVLQKLQKMGMTPSPEFWLKLQIAALARMAKLN